MAPVVWFVCGTLLGLSLGVLFALRARRHSDRLTERLAQAGKLEEELAQTQRAQLQLASQVARLEAELKYERQLSEEKLALLRQSEEKLSQTFQALSSKALRDNNAAFLDLAKTNLERYQAGARADLDIRKQAIEQSVKPLRDSLLKFETKIDLFEKGRAEGHATLASQINTLMGLQTELKSETTKLASALKATSVRGRWGELQLRRVVELAGMVEHCDFTTQSSATSDEGLRRPDLVVHLPGGRVIVVDAKTPLDAFLEASETAEEERKTALLKKHAEQLRLHIRQLASKGYSALFESGPEFVILFVPGESILHAALAQDPSLIEQGAQRDVLLAAPTTLISLLRAASFSWRQEKLSKNAKEISELGSELYRRLVVMTQHFAKVGKHLDTAVKSFNETLGSLERRVLVTARKFEGLSSPQGAATLELPEPIERIPQMPQVVSSD